ADALVARWGFPPFRRGERARVTEGDVAGVPVRLLKPTTYMNASGAALASLRGDPAFDPARDLLILVDDFAIPTGTFRLRSEGSAGNVPFCTVGPNVGGGEVPDPRPERLNELVKPKKKVPAVVEFVDIAGLVKGASQGEGLGNQFLSHIREVDAAVHVIRCFDDPDVVHVMGPVDPVRDHDVITSELARSEERRVGKECGQRGGR